MSEKKKILLNILKEKKPTSYKKIIKYKGNLVDDNLLDSFDIIEIISEIEKKTGKKINSSKISRKYFQDFDHIIKIIK
tara:strand:- start:278 stop:511 length:234 start_codon:yes stop_codon:yes gene_type:complete